MKHKQEETVDKFYERFRIVLYRCKYVKAIEKVMEAETLNYGFSEIKTLEKVYALSKPPTASIPGAVHAEEATRKHLDGQENIKKDHHTTTDQLLKSKGPKKSKPPGNSFDCNPCDAEMPCILEAVPHMQEERPFIREK